MTDKRKALWFGGLALAVLFGGSLVALFAPRFQVAIVLASFVGYLACTRRALALCGVDELVYQPDGGAREKNAREALRTGLIAGTAGALALGRARTGSASAVRSGPSRRGHATYLRPVQRTR